MDWSQEQCQRCGEKGSDRRTLRMACLYKMNEMDLPFEIEGEGGIGQEKFYTLRVCKDCRADWMSAIKKWFDTKPNHEHGLEAGAIYERQFGAARRVT